MSENQPQWQPTNPPTPQVQQSWFARNKVLSMLLGVSLVVLLCCCGGGMLALSGDTDDSTSATSEESTESAADQSDEDEAEETDESDAAEESSESSSSSEPKKEEKTSAKPAETSEESDDSEDFTTEEENAISAAENYLDFMPFSKKGLIQQLSSDAGDGYPKDVAETAVAHIESDVDWNEQAVKSAENYQDLMPMSRSELIQQLSSDAGEGFTKEQAEHAADEVGL